MTPTGLAPPGGRGYSEIPGFDETPRAKAPHDLSKAGTAHNNNGKGEKK